ncbi:MAG: hypothetical protein HQL46_09080 [Gammaproteobacteria bacterium]|nr:hypothetical protein [Gammaproteobacteria bacterium]
MMWLTDETLKSFMKNSIVAPTKRNDAEIIVIVRNILQAEKDIINISIS